MTRTNFWTHYWIFLWNLMPFFVVIALTLCFGIHLLYSLAMVIPGMITLYRLNMRTLARLARQHLSIELACLILGIIIFKEILLASGAMNRVATELALMGMPPVLMVCLLPAIIAFVTGYTTAFIGLPFSGPDAFYSRGRLWRALRHVGPGQTASVPTCFRPCTPVWP